MSDTPILSLYNASIANLIGILNNIEHILKKAEAHALAKNIAPDVFLNARLAPDMHCLIGQVQIATSLAKACPYRLTAQDPPSFEDAELTFADLYARLEKTRKILEIFSREEIDGREGFAFSVKLGPSMRDFIGITYVSGFIIPNVYFHTTTLYNILRHNGVPLGKMDFFGLG